MLPLLISLLMFVLTGFAATALLRRLPVKPDELTQGLGHLAGLRWREFAKLVLQAMQARGFTVHREQTGPADGVPIDGGDILLLRGKERVLLSCKYGNASVVGAQAILGLGKSAELRGAHSAIVVTPGRFDDEARRVAGRQHVELIDGATLWPEVKPLIGEDLGGHVMTRNLDPGRIAMAWLAAAAVGAVTWMVAQGMYPGDTPAPAVASAPVTVPASADAAGPETAVTKVAVPKPDEASADVPTDPAALARRRNETAQAISTLAGVDRAVWSTQSTLLVHLSSEAADPTVTLCPLLERYPELAASRIQLQPPPDSDRPVRFKQCRSY